MAASPTFAGSPAGLAAVKLETGSSSVATPRASLGGQSIAVPADEQGSRAVTPRVSNASATAGAPGETSARVAPEATTNGKQERSPSIFDATHIPTLQTRIHSLTKLILAAGADAHSLAVPKATEPRDGQDGQAEAAMAPPEVVVRDYAPNIALGAATDDDINSGYEAALSLSFGDAAAAAAAATQNQQPTALAEALVRESTGLRDAFARAQRAITVLDGGDMDVEEQDHLIQLLKHYSGEQRRIRRSFVAQSGNIHLPDDTRMAVD